MAIKLTHTSHVCLLSLALVTAFISAITSAICLNHFLSGQNSFIEDADITTPTWIALIGNLLTAITSASYLVHNLTPTYLEYLTVTDEILACSGSAAIVIVGGVLLVLKIDWSSSGEPSSTKIAMGVALLSGMVTLSLSAFLAAWAYSNRRSPLSQQSSVNTRLLGDDTKSSYKIKSTSIWRESIKMHLDDELEVNQRSLRGGRDLGRPYSMNLTRHQGERPGSPYDRQYLSPGGESLFDQVNSPTRKNEFGLEGPKVVALSMKNGRGGVEIIQPGQKLRPLSVGSAMGMAGVMGASVSEPAGMSSPIRGRHAAERMRPMSVDYSSVTSRAGSQFGKEAEGETMRYS